MLERISQLGLAGVDHAPEATKPSSLWERHAKWIEAFVLAALLPTVKLLLGLPDPFFLQGGFPWLLLPLLMVALRHGTLAAFAGGLLLLVMMAAFGEFNPLNSTPSLWQTLAGMTLAILLTGELTGQWQKKYRLKVYESEGLRSNVGKIETEMSVLQLSHAQLEEELLSSSISLRRALHLIEDNLPANQSKTEQEQWLASKMMGVLQSYQWLESAAWLSVEGNTFNTTPLAQLGSMPTISPDDLLLSTAIKSQKTVYLKQKQYLSGFKQSNLIAALPITDQTGKLCGVLAIGQLAFPSYNQQSFNLLAALSAWFGNLLTPNAPMALAHVNPELGSFEQMIQGVDNYMTLLSEQKRSVSAMSIIIPNNNERKQEYADYYRSLLDGNNKIWEHQNDDTLLIVLALPIQSLMILESQQKSMRKRFKAAFGFSMQSTDIVLQICHFPRYKRQKLIAYLKGLK